MPPKRKVSQKKARQEPSTSSETSELTTPTPSTFRSHDKSDKSSRIARDDSKGIGGGKDIGAQGLGIGAPPQGNLLDWLRAEILRGNAGDQNANDNAGFPSTSSQKVPASQKSSSGGNERRVTSAELDSSSTVRPGSTTNVQASRSIDSLALLAMDSSRPSLHLRTSTGGTHHRPSSFVYTPSSSFFNPHHPRSRTHFQRLD
ncbi:hypothetical protein BT69DRAFT_348107 [Atractiella rhizophila]|nr:hypothetical protein BT69DRAFT_348107 [Atractiella rhizophila]